MTSGSVSPALRIVPRPQLIWTAGMVALALVGAFLAIPSVAYVFANSDAPDRTFFLEAARRVVHGVDLYSGWTADYQFRWSPLAAVLLALVLPLGLWVWRLAQFASILSLRRAGWQWRTIVLVLATWPFWFDVQTANVLTFTFVLAVWALRSSNIATWLFLILFVLIPRPLAAPVCVWILWQRPAWRWPFVLLVFVSLAGVAVFNGWGWFGAMLGTVPTETYLNPLNLGPSRWLGVLWIPVGVSLAALFTWKGWLGAACLAASPYLLPYYLLMGLIPVQKPTAAER